MRRVGRPRLLGFLVLLCALQAGCERPPGDPPDVRASVRDSAGVRIVEHFDLDGIDSTSWRVDAEAGVQIGLEDGPSELLFGNVAGFARMRDGRIAVGDAMGPWVRVYQPDGTLSETIGRGGQGPGEYINFRALHPYRADSLLVVDYEGGRWTVLDPDGGFVRSGRPTVRGWTRSYVSPALFGFFADGTALLGSFEGYDEVPLGSVRGGEPMHLTEGRVRFFRAGVDGEIHAEFGTLVASRGLSPVAIEGRAYVWSGLRGGVYWAVRGDHFYYGDAERSEVLVFGAGGELERIVRLQERPGDPPRVAPEEMPEDGPIRTLIEMTPLPERSAAFSDLAVDGAGNLWLREPRPGLGPPREPSSRWFVFDPDGVLRRTVLLPPEIGTGRGPGRIIQRHEQMRIEDDHLLAAVHGPLGAPVLRLLPLHRRPEER